MTPKEKPDALTQSAHREEAEQTNALTSPHLGPLGKVVAYLAKLPVSITLPAGAVLLIVAGLVLLGVHLRARA